MQLKYLEGRMKWKNRKILARFRMQKQKSCASIISSENERNFSDDLIYLAYMIIKIIIEKRISDGLYIQCSHTHTHA